ncbi:tyrosine-type recombinase/integrase [Vibrio vulnificus]|nr:tyrosine-type recombinase/integrase [Vibrio vulnificus]
MATVQLKISDAGIKRTLADPSVTEINAIGEPFELRPHANRETASWFLVTYKGGKRQRYKVANWPDLSVKQAIAQKGNLLIEAALGNRPNLNDWQKVGDLLDWYRDRALTDRSLSDKRKRNIKSSINKHLIPRIGHENISDLCPALLETELLWPLQGNMTISTVRQHFALLKRVFKVATKQKRLEVNPLADVIFTDFFDVKIKGKPSALLVQHLPELWPVLMNADAVNNRLPTLMLMHGTRIGETRQLRWDFIDWHNQKLVIPESLTKGESPELTIMLTPFAVAWLTTHKDWQARSGYRGPYLFPSESRRGCLTENQANDVIASMSQGRWHSHDLRKLARSAWANLGVDYWVSERLLNHAMTGLEETYIHTAAEAQKLKALTLWHEHLQALSTATIAPRTENNNTREAFPDMA